MMTELSDQFHQERKGMQEFPGLVCDFQQVESKWRCFLAVGYMNLKLKREIWTTDIVWKPVVCKCKWDPRRKMRQPPGEYIV